MTWIDYARHVFAEISVFGVSDAHLDWVLWECTAWPMVNYGETLHDQLIEAALEYEAVIRWSVEGLTP